MRNVSDVSALAVLRLVKVYRDGAWSLVSLAHHAILAEGDIRTDHTILAIELDEGLERRAAKLAGLEYDGGFPGWDAVFALLEEMVPREAEGPDVLGRIVEAMYPGDDPDAGWSPETLDEIATILDRAGLRPQTAEAAFHVRGQRPGPQSIKCVVSCRNANGEPDFFPCTVEATEAECEVGAHYVWAREMAAEAGYEEPMLVYDEKDGPRWLFARFFPPSEGEAAVPDALTKAHKLLLELSRLGWLDRAADNIHPDKINDACEAVANAVDATAN